MKNISILGSGAWGTSIANLVAKNNHNVKIWSIIPKVTKEINEKNTNNYFLPNISLSKNLVAYENLEEIFENPEIVFIIIPSTAVDSVLKKIQNLKGKNYKTNFVICSKGIEQKNLKFLSDVIKEYFPDSNNAILSGPNFAEEVAQEIPTVTTIATKDKQLYNEIALILNCDYFKTYYSNDPLGAQICGIMKNIIAISCGISQGIGYCENTKAALITEGLLEIGKVCKIFDGDEEILSQPAGVGDLVLTASSTKSRNFTLGYRLGKGEKLSEILGPGNTTFEGQDNAICAVKIAKKYGLHLPLSEAVYKILTNDLSIIEIQNLIKKMI
jgi:glycerol-3-phosphate dehydrogenase (NAD(P)+)